MIHHSDCDIETIDMYDVVVLGGGIAGVAAALASVRRGLRVCLLEKTCGLGGLATLGNVAIYLPICDGLGHQVIGGLSEELLHLSVADGFNLLPAAWAGPASVEQRAAQRFRVTFNPPSYMLALEELLLREGVDIWYDTLFCEALCTEEHIKAVLVRNKSGQLALHAGMYIDCTGDADLCTASGEETVSLDTNVRSAWFYYASEGAVHLAALSESFASDGTPSAEAQRGYRGDCGKNVTAQVVGSRELLRQHFEAIRGDHPDARLVNVPTMPTFRMTRRLVGAATLSESGAGVAPEDMVGLCPSWRKAGIVYGVPYGALYGQVDNLLAAGRCISAEGRPWDMARAIPVCALTGEIAGTAVALALGADCAVAEVPLASLRAELLATGNIIDADRIIGR